MTTIVTSVGYPAAGKSVVSNWMEERDIPVVSMGNRLRNRFDQVDIEKLEQEFGCRDKSSLLGKWATKQREEYGKEIVADWTCEYIESNIDSEIVFVDGLRSREELSVFTNRFESVEVILVEADEEERLDRIRERGREGESSFTMEDLRERDEREESWGLNQVVEEADYVVENNGTIDEFCQNIDSIFDQISE